MFLVNGVPWRHPFFRVTPRIEPVAPAAGTREAWLLPMLFMVATWAWVALVGCDISWDVVNHHAYLPFSLLSGRYREDLFAAGPQAYQNPAGYLPFYLLLRSEAPAWAVGAVLATVHGLVAWPLHRLTLCVWGNQPASAWWRTLALTLAWSTPAFLLFAGTSSIDPLANLLVLAALAVLLVGKARWLPLCGAGFAVGVAFAIKPVNAVFVIALAASALLRCAVGQQRWCTLLPLVGGMSLGAAVTMGYWTWWLWTTFGNPIFPLYNQIFHSPFAPQQALLASRFLPVGTLDYLLRPWELARFQGFSSIETFAPDIRPLLLALVAVPAAALLLLRRGVSWRLLLTRADVQLMLFALLSYLLWLKTSGNARYAIPLFMLVGLLLCRALQSLCPAPMARIALAVCLVVQMAYYGLNGEHRFLAVAWDAKPYIRADIPQRLVAEPFLHLSLGPLTHAGLATLMHPGGALINLVGQMSLPADGALGQALQSRLHRWQGRTRFLLVGDEADGATVASPARRQRANALVSRHGLRFDFDDCLPIRAPSSSGGAAPKWLLSCGALPRQGPIDGYAHDLASADRVFAAIENACPRVFGPTPMTSDGDQIAWQRRYMNSDARVIVSFTEGVVLEQFRSPKSIRLGSAQEVLAGQGLNPCAAWDALFAP